MLTALHVAGLATLTHTPGPMGFLSSILGRPKNEKPYLLIPVAYPAPDAVAPAIQKKPLNEIRIKVWASQELGYRSFGNADRLNSPSRARPGPGQGERRG